MNRSPDIIGSLVYGGTYALVVASSDWLRLQVGKLGVHCLPPGYYVYVGSARGGLNGRLKHHLKSEKRLHWHIDYLVKQASVTQIWYAYGENRLECVWNTMVAGLPGATSIIPGFGASDCRCRTHLTHFSTAPPFGNFKQMSNIWGLPHPHRLKSELF